MTKLNSKQSKDVLAELEKAIKANSKQPQMVTMLGPDEPSGMKP